MRKKEENMRKTIETLLNSPDAKRVKEELRKFDEEFEIYWQVKKEINLELKAINPNYKIVSISPSPKNSPEKRKYFYDIKEPFEEKDREKICEIFSRVFRKYKLL